MKTPANKKTNVDSMIRKIIGVEKDIPFAQLSNQEQKDYWNVSTVFRTEKYGRVSKYKSGKGMKLIETFVANA